MTQVRTPFLRSLPTGPRPEPPISNEDFLDSFLRFSGWLRVTTVWNYLELLNHKKFSVIDELTLATTCYEQFAMQMEDATSMLVALGIWKHNPSENIADVLSKINFVRLDPKKYSDTYFRMVFTRPLAGKIKIDPVQFLENLERLKPRDVLKELGVPWKDVPSVKLVPTSERDVWSLLPGLCESLINLLNDKNRRLLTTSYNKIKHGPQLVVQEPPIIAERGRGFTNPEQLEGLAAPGQAVRLLFEGSRTQEDSGETESGKRVAPFLFAEPDALRILLFEAFVPVVASLWEITKWVRFAKFGKTELFLKDQKHLGVVQDWIGREREPVVDPKTNARKSDIQLRNRLAGGEGKQSIASTDSSTDRSVN